MFNVSLRSVYSNRCDSYCLARFFLNLSVPLTQDATHDLLMFTSINTGCDNRSAGICTTTSLRNCLKEFPGVVCQLCKCDTSSYQQTIISHIPILECVKREQLLVRLVRRLFSVNPQANKQIHTLAVVQEGACLPPPTKVFVQLVRR